MADQTSDPVQDAGLVSPPIQGVDEGVVKSGDEGTAHVPITTPPEETQTPVAPAPETPATGPQPGQTPPSDTDPSAGGIITRPLTPPTAGQAETPVQEPNTPPTTNQPYPGTPTDTTGGNSSNLA